MFVRCEEEEERKKRKGGQGGGCCVPPPPVFLAPVVVIFLQWNSASDYFSGSVHAYTRTESTIPLPACYMRLPDVVASFDGISQHLTCIPPLSISYTLSCYSSPRCQNLLLFYVALLCLRHYPPLCISTSIAYLSSGTIRHVLTARCLSAAYPGIQQMVLISFPRNSLLSLSAMSYPFC